MRNRNRWIYRMTGLPGWMRFGFSPGWIGRSPTGLGPAAQYLSYGRWPTPQMNHIWQQGEIPFSPGPGFPQPGFTTPYDPWGATAISPEQELNFLKAEAEQLEDELYSIEKRIEELEGKK
jgi:hypothetical protein